MSLVKIMKRRTWSSPSIKALPLDLVKEICAFVAASSRMDLSNMKLTCKEFHEAAIDSSVFRRVTIKDLPVIVWNLSSKASSFLNQCEVNGNPEAIYRRGMIEYFSKQNSELGCQLLKKASESGHVDSTYVLGIILISNESSRIEGKKLLDKLESTILPDGISICRVRTKKILREMWISNCIQGWRSTCTDTSCRNGGRRGFPKKGEWLCEEELFCCQDCRWSYELTLFCNVFVGV